MPVLLSLVQEASAHCVKSVSLTDVGKILNGNQYFAELL